MVYKNILLLMKDIADKPVSPPIQRKPIKSKLPKLTLDECIKIINNNTKTVITQAYYLPFIKRIFTIMGTDNFLAIIKSPKRFKDKLESAKQVKGNADDKPLYSTISKMHFCKTILKVIKNLPNDIPINEKTVDDFTKICEDYTSTGKLEVNERSRDKEHSVMRYSDFLADVKESGLYKPTHPLIMLLEIFYEVPQRDNFGSLIVIENDNQVEDEKINYIIIPPNKRKVCVVVLQKYKTAKKYNTIRVPLSKELSKLVRRFMHTHDVNYNERFFSIGKQSPDGTYRMADFLAYNLKKVFNKRIGFNEIRKMRIADLSADDKIDLDTRKALAQIMGHSVETSMEHYSRLENKDGYGGNADDDDDA